MNLKMIGGAVVVGWVAISGFNSSKEQQANIDRIAVEQNMSPVQKAAFEACVSDTKKVRLKGWQSPTGQRMADAPVPVEVCACQSAEMVKVFADGRYSSHGDLVRAMADGNPETVSFKPDDLKDEWKSNARMAPLMVGLAMGKCVEQQRGEIERMIDNARSGRS